MHMCVCVCVCVCVCTSDGHASEGGPDRVREHASVCTLNVREARGRLSVSMSDAIHTYTHIYTCARAHTHTGRFSVSMSVAIHTYTHIYTFARARTHTHIHTHTHTHRRI